MNEIVRTAEVLVLLAISAVAQSLFANYFPTALYLDLPLVFALYIGWHSSPVKGAVCGVFLGWLQDAILGIYLGLNGLTKTLIGFGGSYLSKWLLLEGFWARCLLISLLSALDSLIILGVGNALGQTVQRGIWMRTLIQMPTTGIAGGLMFWVYDRLKFPKKDFRSL